MSSLAKDRDAFTSTIDAYRDFHQVGITEDYPLAVLPPGTPHNPSRFYGALKALCEAEVHSAFPGRATIIRPGWVVGPRDNGNFFTYWVMRVRRGGEFLAPGTERDPIQMVDARDLAAFVMKAASEKIGGPKVTFLMMAAILGNPSPDTPKKIQQAQRVGHRRAFFADFFRALFLRPIEFAHQQFVCAREFDRIQVFALDIFDQPKS